MKMKKSYLKKEISKMLKNKFSCLLHNLYYIIDAKLNLKTQTVFTNHLPLTVPKPNSVDTQTYYNNLLRHTTKNAVIQPNLPFTLQPSNKLQKIILYINRTSLTLKSNRMYRYKITTGIGVGNKWIGIGDGKNKLFKNSYLISLNSSKKNIYSLNFHCNDYTYITYKGCKFKAINASENKKNLKIYENIIKLSGHKKIKLISYESKTPTNILKSIMRFF